ncbi:hypothetical protein JKP88DRAFT_195489, partial [Tribonema minus]
MCAEDAMGSPTRLDLAVAEFTLNDGIKYDIGGAFDSLPYELMLRTLLSAFDHPPALLTLHFWGSRFEFKSPQAALVALSEAYDLTAISIRDAIWPYYKSQREPFATKQECTLDGLHPSLAVEQLTADLLFFYINLKFVKWVDGAIDGTASTTDGKDRVPLPAPSAANKDILAGYKLNKARFDCAIVRESGRDNGHAPVLIDAVDIIEDDVGTLAYRSCMKFTSAAARAKVEVSMATGRVF